MDALVVVFCVLLDVHAVSKFVEEGGGWSCSMYLKNKDGSLCVYVGVTGFIFFCWQNDTVDGGLGAVRSGVYQTMVPSHRYVRVRNHAGSR